VFYTESAEPQVIGAKPEPKAWVYTKAKVLRVIDGDTVDCEVDVGFRLKAFLRFRLCSEKGYFNCPEKNTNEGVLAKAFTTNNALGKDVEIRCFGPDDFSRWLADIVIDGVSLCDMLLNAGHAKLGRPTV
jgi:micrococcal nuclease